jgi:hypothetical protein
LGRGEFIEQLLSEAEEKAKETLDGEGGYPVSRLCCQLYRREMGWKRRRFGEGTGGGRWWEFGNYFAR